MLQTGIGVAETVPVFIKHFKLI